MIERNECVADWCFKFELKLSIDLQRVHFSWTGNARYIYLPDLADDYHFAQNTEVLSDKYAHNVGMSLVKTYNIVAKWF